MSPRARRSYRSREGVTLALYELLQQVLRCKIAQIIHKQFGSLIAIYEPRSYSHHIRCSTFKMVYQPEMYFLKPSEYAPNNELPVLVYRDCLPLPLSEEKTKTFLESHAWVRKGTWGHIDVRHFHPNTHECYGLYNILPQYGSSITSKL